MYLFPITNQQMFSLIYYGYLNLSPYHTAFRAMLHTHTHTHTSWGVCCGSRVSAGLWACSFSPHSQLIHTCRRVWFPLTLGHCLPLSTDGLNLHVGQHHQHCNISQNAQKQATYRLYRHTNYRKISAWPSFKIAHSANPLKTEA